MLSDMILRIIFLFIMVFVFDISFNLRRLIKNMDRIWRKLAEINESLKD